MRAFCPYCGFRLEGTSKALVHPPKEMCGFSGHELSYAGWRQVEKKIRQQLQKQLRGTTAGDQRKIDRARAKRLKRAAKQQETVNA